MYHHPAMCIVTITAWVFIAALLIYLTWNQVFSFLWKFKKVKYWQALLLIVTVAFLLAPKYYFKSHYGRGWGKGYHHGGQGKGDFKKDWGSGCPYHGGKACNCGGKGDK